MANHSSHLDAVFRALSDPTRRAVVHRLAHSPTTVKELAEPYDMALPSFMKHLSVLEECGLIISEKSGRVRTCTLRSETMLVAESWLGDQIELWEGRTERLATYVESQLAKDES